MSIINNPQTMVPAENSYLKVVTKNTQYAAIARLSSAMYPQ